MFVKNLRCQSCRTGGWFSTSLCSNQELRRADAIVLSEILFRISSASLRIKGKNKGSHSQEWQDISAEARDRAACGQEREDIVRAVGTTV